MCRLGIRAAAGQPLASEQAETATLLRELLRALLTLQPEALASTWVGAEVPACSLTPSINIRGNYVGWVLRGGSDVTVSGVVLGGVVEQADTDEVSTAVEALHAAAHRLVAVYGGWLALDPAADGELLLAVCAQSVQALLTLPGWPTYLATKTGGPHGESSYGYAVGARLLPQNPSMCAHGRL